MTILCPHCSRHRSRVVESRSVPIQIKYRGVQQRTRTMQRRRECLSCRYRWLTIELLKESRRGKKAEAQASPD